MLMTQQAALTDPVLAAPVSSISCKGGGAVCAEADSKLKNSSSVVSSMHCAPGCVAFWRGAGGWGLAAEQGALAASSRSWFSSCSCAAFASALKQG